MKLTFTLIILCFSLELMAQKAGTLDNSFGDSGIVTTTFDSASGEARAVVISPGSYIIVAGNEYVGLPSRQCFSIVKYRPDGVPDSTFGKIGKVKSYFSKIFAYTYCAALQPDGKILVGGSMSSDMAGYGNYFVLIRYLKNGTPDSSFGHSGLDTTILKHNIGGEFHAVFIQSDGKIVGVGKSADENYIAIRYLPDGKLDSSYGINGVANADFRNDYCVGGALQPDGKIIAGGYTYDYRSGKQELMIVRFTSAGKTDSSFGRNGMVITDLGLAGIKCNAMALQADGKIILEGTYFKGGNNIVLTRFNNDGQPDKTFGTNGKQLNVYKNFPWGNAMALQADGKIVVAGYVYFQPVNKIFFGLARYQQNGDVDSSFGFNGGVQTIYAKGGEAYAVAIQQDGKIVAAGKIYRGVQSIEEYGTIRYNNGKSTLKQVIVKHYIPDDAQATTLSNISIYPNPAQNVLHVEGLSLSQNLPADRQGTKLTVVDFNGNIAMSYELSPMNSSCNLNIASLHAGNYLLKIETNGEVVTKQFVKE